jgi:hypothetical protein
MRRAHTKASVRMGVLGTKRLRNRRHGETGVFPFVAGEAFDPGTTTRR